MLGLIRIQTVGHSDGIPERIFIKNQQSTKKNIYHATIPRRQRVKHAVEMAKSSSTSILCVCKQLRLHRDCAYAKAHLSLGCLLMR